MQVGIITTNNYKLEEFVKILSKYKVECVQVQELGSEYPYYLKETTILKNGDTVVADPEPGDTVTHVSTLSVYGPNKGLLQDYVSRTSGFIQKCEDPGDSFGWDHLFVPYHILGLSNYELRKTDLKVSARQINISSFCMDYLKLTNEQKFKYHGINQKDVVDFDYIPYDFLTQHSKISKYLSYNPMLKGLLNAAINKGAFFRQSKTPRERNYWWPGLNGGIPTTPKKDEIHELTFFIHDVFHQLMPDLAPDTKDVFTYVMYRMLSEVHSLVLADMLFVDCMYQYGLDNPDSEEAKYDWSKRRIAPLYWEIKNNSLPDIISAMTDLCLKGDESKILSLGADKSTVSHFRNKYDAFFVRDYQWTLVNYQAIEGIDFHVKGLDIPMPKTSEYLSTDLGTLLLKVKLVPEELMPRETVLDLTFRKYLYGQIVGLGRYFKNVALVDKLLFELVNNLPDVITEKDIYRSRNLFNSLIDFLTSLNAFAENDGTMFKNIVPLFDPFFVDYDLGLDIDLTDMFKTVAIWRK